MEVALNGRCPNPDCRRELYFPTESESFECPYCSQRVSRQTSVDAVVDIPATEPPAVQPQIKQAIMTEKHASDSPRKDQQARGGRLMILGLGILVYFGLFGLALHVLFVLLVVSLGFIAVSSILRIVFKQAAPLVFASVVLPGAWLIGIDDFRLVDKVLLFTLACIWVCITPWIRGWTGRAKLLDSCHTLGRSRCLSCYSLLPGLAFR